MPIHDWSRVSSGLFHHFHQHWSVELTTQLNRGRLPRGLSALVEQRAGPKQPDVLAIEHFSPPTAHVETNGGVAVQERPVARIVRKADVQIYAAKANRIVIRHQLGRIVAVIEIVSPGNKDSRAALRDFAEKTVQFIQKGIHVLVVDLFPPSAQDPFGMHKVIWDEILVEDFAFPDSGDRVVASYDAREEKIAYVETLRVGDPLPEIPLMLVEELFVKVPLEESYTTTWVLSPEPYRLAVATGEFPAIEESN